MDVERIAVSTLVKIAATIIGSVVFTVVVCVLVPSWLAAAYFGPQTGSSGAALAMGLIPLVIVTAAICLPLTGLYLFHLLGQVESRARLNTFGRFTVACVGSSVLAAVILIPVMQDRCSESVLADTAVVLLSYPLAFCALWSMLGLFLFRKLKSCS